MKKFFLLILCAGTILASSGCVFNRNRVLKNQIFENLNEEFVPLKETVSESPFSDIEDFFELEKASGKAVLYDNTICNIDVEYDGYNLDITVGDESVSVYAQALCDIKTVDLVENDGFYEIAVSSDGASADPSVSFIRYDGNSLIPIYHDNTEYDYGSIYGDLSADESDIYPTYGAIWSNKKGTLITSFQNIGFISPRIALSCFELTKDNTWTESEFKSPEFPKEYKISESFEGFFTPMSEPPKDFDNSDFIFGVPFEDRKSFKQGDEIKILDFGPLYNYYSFYIEYNGEKGVLAFWLGD